MIDSLNWLYIGHVLIDFFYGIGIGINLGLILIKIGSPEMISRVYEMIEKRADSKRYRVNAHRMKFPIGAKVKIDEQDPLNLLDEYDRLDAKEVYIVKGYTNLGQPNDFQYVMISGSDRCWDVRRFQALEPDWLSANIENLKGIKIK